MKQKSVFLSVILFLLSAGNVFAQKLQGRVTDKRGEPLIGATVVVVASTNGTTTDLDGNYSLAVPAGTVTVEVSYLSYRTRKISGVEVTAGKTTPLDVVLDEDNTQLGEVVVTGAHSRSSTAGLLAQQRQTVAFTDGFSAEQMKRTADNNVAQVLKRVAGVTVQDNKFVTVRGMSERYNSVTLNGSSMPSTEPNRRNFAFDLIPTALIDNVIVYKTFTPDLSGDFTGGMVSVSTLAIPHTRYISLSAGTGTNSVTAGQDFQTNKRFAADYFTGEIDGRSWYAGRQAPVEESAYNASRLNHFGYYNYKATPVQNYTLTVGLPILSGKHNLGLVAAATYRHEENIEDIKEMRLRTSDTLVTNLGPKYNHKYKFVTATGIILNTGWETDGHQISWRNLFNNRFTHNNLNRVISDDYNSGVPGQELLSTILHSQLWQTQLDGTHQLFSPNLTFSWDAGYNSAVRTNPDDRYTQGGFDGQHIDSIAPDGKYRMDWSRGGPSYPFLSSQYLMFSELKETKATAGLNLEYRFNLLNQPQKLKAGYSAARRSAVYDQLYLHTQLTNNPAATPFLSGTSLHEFYDPANFDAGYLFYKKGIDLGSGEGADFYDGEQRMNAAYFFADISPLKPLHIIGGIRREDVKTSVGNYFFWYDDIGKLQGSDSLFVRNDRQWLPALTVVYSIVDNLNLRASFSKTLARPDFRELTSCAYYDVESQMDVINLKAVEESTAKNYDLRLEWYPGEGEVIAFSAFQKEFLKPLEKVVVSIGGSGASYRMYTINLDRAMIRGLELNVRKSFGFITPALNDLWIGGNGSVLEGNVEYSLFGRARDRILQGLAPYSINASMAYEGKRFGASANYIRNGRILLESSNDPTEDEYENPRNVLDFQLYARFLNQRLEVKLNAGDVLNEDLIIYRNCGTNAKEKDENSGRFAVFKDRSELGMDYNPGDWVVSRIKKGVNLSLSVSYKI